MAILIGVHVHAEPSRLAATLASLRAEAPEGTVVLLPDGPDAATRAALAGPAFADLPRLGTDEPRGAPACWNRLVRTNDAEVVVLLESGCLIGPGAIARLVAALAEPRHGLAGPSTNLAWNEQGAFPGRRDSPEAVAATAAEALRRFGGAVRPLAPLHSLADFCFVARRDVIEVVGAADEGYGLGPCWEMDYNIRAARAGLLGVWVGAAYVQRAPFTARRRQEESTRFEASRRRYQDKFCGRRLSGGGGPYESHCKGEACADFAPPSSIRVHEPLALAPAAPALPPPAVPELPSPASLPAPDRPPPAIVPAADRPPPAPSIEVVARGPRVSCIMPTRDRRAWVPQAIRGFLRQDYADAELVILDDGESPVGDCVPEHPRIRYHRIDGRHTVGWKRNEACRLARGQLIAHWDDDDWYPPTRLRRQVEALDASQAALCGTSTVYFYQPSAERAWRYRYPGAAAPMLVGTSLLYARRLWEQSPFADIQVGEDVRFVRAAPGRRCDLADPELAVATIHESNTSPRTPDALFWSPHPVEGIHRLLGEDLAFFRRGGQPLVSCIMPTFNRRAFVPLGLRRYLEQDWPSRELIVVDDGSDPVEDLVAGLPGVRYLRLRRRAPIGAKRNIACSEARGELIAHWDDDDWYGPRRLSAQAAPILAGDADLTGLGDHVVLRLPQADFWTTRRQLHRRMFVGDVHGGTIVFRRSLFTSGLRYPEVNLAEDAALIREVIRRGGRVHRLTNHDLFVYVRHGANAWQFEVGRFLDPSGWTEVARPPSVSPEILDAYRRAAAAL